MRINLKTLGALIFCIIVLINRYNILNVNWCHGK